MDRQRCFRLRFRPSPGNGIAQEPIYAINHPQSQEPHLCQREWESKQRIKKKPIAWIVTIKAAKNDSRILLQVFVVPPPSAL